MAKVFWEAASADDRPLWSHQRCNASCFQPIHNGFNKKNDDSVDICVSVFNNSLVAAKNVICSWYLGEPDEDMNPPDNRARQNAD